ncbi:MAG: hypothetical protein IJH12_06415 [Clostridia bacterium]|nr:hypothetical protein [Clostridia bacterium]
MFETGKKAYFRSADFTACIGTIVGIAEENSATVTLLVKDNYGTIHTVKKVKPVNQVEVENFYRERGYY